MLKVAKKGSEFLHHCSNFVQYKTDPIQNLSWNNDLHNISPRLTGYLSTVGALDLGEVLHLGALAAGGVLQLLEHQVEDVEFAKWEKSPRVLYKMKEKWFSSDS